MKRVPMLVRLPVKEHAQLKLAAKAYRAPSINWFVGEMLQCMLNPGRWEEFSLRLSSGTHQLTLEGVEKVRPVPRIGRPPKKRRPA